MEPVLTSHQQLINDYLKKGWLNTSTQNSADTKELTNQFEALNKQEFTLTIDAEIYEPLEIGDGLLQWGLLLGYKPIHFVKHQLLSQIIGKLLLDRTKLYIAPHLIFAPIPGKGNQQVIANLIYRPEVTNAIIRILFTIPEVEPEEAAITTNNQYNIPASNFFYAELDQSLTIARLEGRALAVFGVDNHALIGIKMFALFGDNYIQEFEEFRKKLNSGLPATYYFEHKQHIISGYAYPGSDTKEQTAYNKILTFNFISPTHNRSNLTTLNTKSIFNSLVKEKSHPFLFINLEGTILHTNKGLEEFAKNLPNAQLNKGSNLITFMKDWISEYEIRQKIGSRKNFDLLELEIPIKDQLQIINLVFTYHNTSNSEYYFIKIDDITELYFQSLNNKRSETLLQKILACTPVGILVTDAHFTDIKICNEGFLNLFGFEKQQELQQHIESLTKASNNNAFNLWTTNIVQELNIVGEWDGLVKANQVGAKATFHASVRRFTWKNSEFNLLVCIDRTLEYTTLQKAELTEQRFRAMFQSSPVPTTVYDIDSLEFIETNKAFRQQYGYNHIEMRAVKVNDLWPTDMYAEIESYFNFNKVLATEYNFKTKHRTKQQEIIDVEIVSHPLPFEIYGRRTRLATVINITDTLKLTTRLIEQKAFLRSILDKIPYPIFLKDKTKKYVLVNQQFIDDSRKEEDAIIGKSDIEIFGINQLTNLFSETDILAKQGQELSYEHTLNSINTEKHFLTLKRVVDMPDAEGCILGISTDITRLKNAEFKLAEREELFQELFEGSPDALFVVGTADPSIQDCNMAAVKLFEATHKSDIVGKKGIEFQTDHQQNETALRILSDAPITNAISAELQYRGLRGRTFWGSIAVSPLTKVNHDKLLVRITDITHTKNLFKRVEDSLHEKEILLREIHHRVKNNLAVIISLLSLQTYPIEDAKLKDILKECINRIRSMAILHEELYRNTNLSKIDFGSYLRNLGSHLAASIDQNQNVNIIVSGDQVSLNILKAVPCGLILNELITNSFKHAFKDSRKGLITIALAETDGMVRIDYKDNGQGIVTESIDKDKFSLGSMLISELSKQLKAQVQEFTSNHSEGGGYRLILTFPIH